MRPEYVKEIRRTENIKSQHGVELDIITGLPPVLMASMTVGTKYYWLERDGFINFAATREQAEWDRREYILEVLC